MKLLEGRISTGGINPIPDALKSFCSPKVVPVKSPGPTNPCDEAEEIVPLKELEVIVLPVVSFIFWAVIVKAAAEVK